MWIIDSGCSTHMTCDKALLSQFVEKVGHVVTFGDNKKGFTMGYVNLLYGDVVIENVALVEGLRSNFLSVSQFTDRVFKVDFNQDVCLISYRKTNELDFKGVIKGNLFVVDMDSADKNKI